MKSQIISYTVMAHWFQQFFNQDTGYGVCKSCVPRIQNGMAQAEFERIYGKPGINYESVSDDVK